MKIKKSRLPSQLNPPDVLIVDEDEHSQERMRDILVERGFNVQIFSNGMEAVKNLRRVKPHIALIDIRLPDMDGISLMKLIKKFDNEIDVVIITGNASVHNAITALNEGATRYILKPPIADELISSLKNIIEMRNLRERNKMYMKRLEVLHSLTDKIAMVLVPDEIAKLSMESLVTLGEIDSCAICLIEGGNESKNISFNQAARWGIELDSLEKITSLPTFEKFIRNEKNKFLCLWEEKCPGDMKILFKNKKLKRIILLKIKGQVREVGIVLLGSKVKKLLDKHEIELLNAMALQIGMALEKADLYRKTQRAYEELKSAQESLILAEKLSAIGRLTAGLAHEIGTPLNIISGRSEYILGLLDKNDEHISQSLNIIIQQIERISMLIRQLLDFSRKYTPVKEKINLNKVINSVISLVQNQLKKNDIEIKIFSPKELPPVMANENQIQQVFLNLLVNSVDAIVTRNSKTEKREKGEIMIIFEDVMRTKKVRIQIIDNGIGIPAENLNKIFDPFFTTKEVGTGTGLGLAVVYGIITEHGGTIEVESNYGMGTTFIFSLPSAD